MNKKALSLEEKFGQMILLGLDVYEINDEIKTLIKDYKIGGVVLYKKNYTSLSKMNEVINELKSLNKDNKAPLFIAIDQENGRVNRFPKEITPIYNPLKQAHTKDMKIINGVNDITTYILKSVGINMNLAPVLDINRNIKNKVVGNRSYGETKEDVIEYAIPFMKKMQENNLISVIKHFPGHGATNKDSHFSLPKIKNINKLEENDLCVFKEAISKGADVLMTGHLRLKGFGLKPTIINKNIIDKYLKDYKGLIMTDDLRMNILSLRYGLKNIIKKSIDAGNNIIMVKYRKNDIKRLYKKLFNMVKYCEIDIEKINDSANKIVALKEKYQINDGMITAKMNIDLINDRINKINNLIDKKISE